MYEYRVTKYDPALRDAQGRYTRDDWTSVGDIGRSFDGVVLTTEEYERVEASYSTSALGFLHEAGVTTLAVVGLEDHAGTSRLAEGDLLDLSQLANIISRVLREEFWCRLEIPGAFVHFGWDYYLYVCLPVPCADSVAAAERMGLFVESCGSPYKVRETIDAPDIRSVTTVDDDRA